MSRSIGLRQLRHHTGQAIEALDGVTAVTDRGRVVAYLVPAGPEAEPVDEALRVLAERAPISAAILTMLKSGPVDGGTAEFLDRQRVADRALDERRM